MTYSVNDIAGAKARAFEKRITSLLVVNWNREYSELSGFMCANMALAVIRANIPLLCGALNDPSGSPL